METLTELVAKITVDAENLKRGLSQADKDVKGLGKTTDKETKSIKDRFLEIGKTATIMGAAITTTMGLVIRSFVKTGSELSDLSLKTGVSVKALAGLKYAAEQNGASLGTVEMAIRRTASAMQDAKDGLAETKRAFDRMNLSLDELEGLKPEDQFMKIAEAIAEIPDPMTRAATAQDLFGRSGMDMLPMLSQGADGLRKMMEEGVKLTGWSTEAATLADSLGDAFDTLKTAMTGIFNVIGASLAPALKNIATTLTNITSGVIAWIQAHPSLVKAISTATLAVGLFATGVGLASLAVKFLGTTTNLYFGGILIAIGAVVTGIVLLIDWFNRGAAASKKLADDQKAALEKQMADDKAYFAQKRQQTETTYNNAIQKIREEYGIYESAQKNKMDLAKDATALDKRILQIQLDNARKVHNEKIDMLEQEYDEKIRTLNAEADYQIKSIQNQIDAIDAQTEAEDTANRITELQSRINDAKIAESKAKTIEEITAAHERGIAAQQDLDRFLLLQQRENDKKVLRDKIDIIKQSTQTEEDRLKNELESQTKNYKAEFELLQTNLQLRADALDTELETTLKRLDDERIAKEKAEAANLETTLHNIGEAETALRNSYDTRLNQTIEWVRNMNLENAKLQDVDYTVTRHEITMRSADETIPRKEITMRSSEGVNLFPISQAPIIPELASGGIVTQPTLAMVGESGAEAIIPLNETSNVGGITINFTQPVFFDREDTMNRFVDMIAKGIDRKQRLRFGGAYSGS